MTRVYVRHLRSQNWCVKGIRYWFEVHGLDYKDFVRNGIEADVVRATGDSHGVIAANLAEQEEARL